MLTSFARLDSALIERVFQPVVDAMAQRLGLGRLRVAGYFLDVASLAWILSQAGSLSGAAAQWQADTACLRLLLLMLGLAALCSLRTLFQRSGDGRGGNPLRVTMLPHRGVLLALLASRLFALGGFAAAADLAMLACAVCALYLGACVSRPPLRRASSAAAAGSARRAA